MSESSFDDMFTWVYKQVSTARKTNNADTKQDEEFDNHIKFLSNVLPYMMLTDAIRFADIELLRHSIRDILISFAAMSSRTKYQFELCRFYAMIATDACDERLQEIILRETMINREGRVDSYYEMDRANELINFELRKANDSRRTSSHPIRNLVRRHLRCQDVLTALKEIVNSSYRTKQNSIHTKNDKGELIWLMASEATTNSESGLSGLAQQDSLDNYGLQASKSSFSYIIDRLSLTYIVLKPSRDFIDSSTNFAGQHLSH
jgi:hypothetical protein